MGQVACTRCDSTSEGLDRAPLPGKPGELVLEKTCRPCWDEWRAEQVKLINENKLSPARTDDYAFLIEQMKRFLKLA